MTQASRQLIDVMRGMQTEDSEMLRALETAEQAIGNVLERTEEQQQMAAYVGQCIQSLQWMALQREADYEKMQIFSFMKLREEAEKSIKPRSEDPMKRNAPRKPAETLPSFSQSVTAA